MKTLTLLTVMALLFFSCSERKYTVQFIKGTDTGYLMNRQPLTFDEAEKIAKGFRNQGQATPYIWDSAWRQPSDTIIEK